MIDWSDKLARTVFATGTEIILRKETIWLDPIIKCQSFERRIRGPLTVWWSSLHGLLYYRPVLHIKKKE